VKANGDASIRADPPLIVPISDLVDHPGAQRFQLGMRTLLAPPYAACPVVGGNF
jgi:hypothetical protein